VNRFPFAGALLITKDPAAFKHLPFGYLAQCFYRTAKTTRRGFNFVLRSEPSCASTARKAKRERVLRPSITLFFVNPIKNSFAFLPAKTPLVFIAIVFLLYCWPLANQAWAIVYFSKRTGDFS
jgi:hypothetical protein